MVFLGKRSSLASLNRINVRDFSKLKLDYSKDYHLDINFLALRFFYLGLNLVGIQLPKFLGHIQGDLS